MVICLYEEQITEVMSTDEPGSPAALYRAPSMAQLS